jgi:C4-type Zn-finger protein
MHEIKFKTQKYKCPCCGYYTLDVMECHEKPFFEICEVCGWMYDEVDQEHPERPGGNHISFNKAKENYKKIGRVREVLDFCRLPYESEFPENNGEI